MDKWTTANVSMNVFSTVFELYREIKNPEIFKASLPYDLTEVSDDLLNNKMGKLSEDFYEKSYDLKNGSLLKATIDVAFHKNEGLVNFNMLTSTNKLFKKRHLRHITNEILFPYVDNITNNMLNKCFIINP